MICWGKELPQILWVVARLSCGIICFADVDRWRRIEEGKGERRKWGVVLYAKERKSLDGLWESNSTGGKKVGWANKQASEQITSQSKKKKKKKNGKSPLAQLSITTNALLIRLLVQNCQIRSVFCQFGCEENYRLLLRRLGGQCHCHAYTYPFLRPSHSRAVGAVSAGSLCPT